MLEIAITAARKGGEVLKKYFETSLAKRVKDDNSFVTDADEETEKAIIHTIQSSYPDHGILAEESGVHETSSAYQWIIDPLDGTSNFANGIPIFAISIALLHSQKQVLGVVCNPITNSLFFAEKGKGAFWNEQRIAVSQQDASQSMITIGTSNAPQDKEIVRKLFVGAKDYVKSVRYLGSSVLGLAYLARGGTEGLFNVGTNKWDYAAGTLLVREAGGMLTDFEGNPWTFEQNYFIASNGVIHPQLLALAKDISYKDNYSNLRRRRAKR